MKTRSFVSMLILCSTIVLIGGCATTSRRIIRTSARGNYWATKGLIAKGVNVNISDAFGQTALHKAAIDGNAFVVWELILAGADVNIRDKEGRTALMFASNYEIENILKAAGAIE